MAQSAPACTEHELVAAVRRGDNRAFEELYSRYRSRIAAYILGMVGDHARAEDLAQEVFISALRRLRDTERPIAFKPWIYEIAKNACIDEFRRNRRAREVPLATDEEEGGGERDLPSTAPPPDAAVENKQSLVDLRGAFHGLSENHHKLIVMREFEGLSYAQIAERLGMTVPVVESSLFRARRRLTEEYDELVSGRRCEHVQNLIHTTEARALRKLGVRERRQLARHLSHCQPCRRHARMAGVDESVFQAPTVIGKIAALLPFPWLRWRRGSGNHEPAETAAAHSFLALRSLPVVARLTDSPATAGGVGRAAAAAAAVALAGFGGGVVTAVSTHPTRASSGHGRALGGSSSGLAARAGASIQPAQAAGFASTGSAPTVVGRGASSRTTSSSGRSQAASGGGTPGPSSSARKAAHGGSVARGSVVGGATHQVNKVLSAATSTATGAASRATGVSSPRTPSLAKVTHIAGRVVSKLGKTGATTLPGTHGSAGKTGSPLAGAGSLTGAVPPTPTVSTPQLPDPTKIVKH